MSRFWLCISFVLGIVLLSPILRRAIVGPPLRMYHQYSIWDQLYGFTVGGTLVAVIWAICFRSQVERLQFSVFSLIVLVVMEAVFFTVVRIADPLWAGLR